MNQQHWFGNTVRKIGHFFGRLPYMRVLAVILALSIFFPLVPNPVAAEQAEKKKQAQHLLSALQQVVNGSYEAEDEEEEKTEDTKSSADEAQETDTEADDQQDIVFSGPKEMTLITPEGDVTLSVDESGQITATAEDTTVKTDID